MAALTLYLVRHPEPEIAPGICYGRLDIPARQVDVAAARLRSELPAGLPVWSSPLQRCRALAEALHPAPLFDARLQEMDFGRWEGVPWDEVSRAELDAWAADVENYAPPGGESPLMVRARVLEFLSTLTLPAAVLVTHAGVIRLLLAAQDGGELASWLTRDLPYASCTVIEWNQ
ncbi:MAG: alpha-ribazole phosphatase family protein [Dechloromonas sp.]|jgi:alpha-ribazole phosphatase|uniref:alpha-ribazole phosphatase family protein n=1 Tax=Azonexus hydrophilus TaxID=418702 RepID=UPI0003FB8A86|nr:alpha-ribazole phosphatase family protein [Azonexus hydrophilus]MBS4017148.1 alpha-ribazole phosphatase family protein [Dechloromonas sp.]MCA1939081.1 alpha-ribazole phosphatase family protein [Dechloromonas sp.]